MEHHFVNRVSRFLPSSFSSCQFGSVPDVVESSIPITKTTKVLHHDIQPPKSFSNVHKRSSMIKPQEPKILKNDKIVSKYQRRFLLLGSDAEGRRCPPVTPISVMASKKKERAKETKMNNSISSSNSGRWFSSEDEEAEFDGKSDTFFSLSSGSSESFLQKITQSTTTNGIRSDNKMSTESGRCSSALSAYSVNTVLSQYSLETTKNSCEKTRKHGKPARSNSKTWQRRETVHNEAVLDGEILTGCEASEASTELYYNGFGSTHDRRKTAKSRRKTTNNHRRRKGQIKSDKGQCSIVVEDGVEDSYAVEKSTSDPYNDFRTSMVEMIIEKQIFGAKDLEKLLDCYLSLNSPYYHKVIIEVFAEICDTLFAN